MDGIDAAGRTQDLYDAHSIVILRGLEAVRARPAMYVGSTGLEGVYHLLFEVVQNAIDETMAGHCNAIVVTVHSDGSLSVVDDGRGIPVDLHPRTGRPACEVVLTTLHSGGKFLRAAYGNTGGLHGVGLACVNALSEWLILDVRRASKHYQQRYRRGEPDGDVCLVGDASGRGTSIHFQPDPRVFNEGTALSAETLGRRLQELAFLQPGVEIRFRHMTEGVDEVYRGAGTVAFVEHLNRARTSIHSPPIEARGESGGVVVDAALQWTTAYADEVLTYVNGVRTFRGGTHLEGLKSGVTGALRRFSVESGLVSALTEGTVAAYDVYEGLTGVLSIKMDSPEFDGQTKAILSSPVARDAVARVIHAQLLAFLQSNRDSAARIVGKVLEASRARAFARRAGERARYQGVESGVSKDIYRAQFGVRSRNWHQSARWITDQGLLAAHADLCQVANDARVLDVCCGSGVVGASFRGRVGRIVGLDLTPEMLKLAVTRLDEVHEGDVYRLPFADESFDLVVNREVLHLLPNPALPLRQMWRVLRPGGQLIVGQLVPYSDADAPWMFRLLKKKQPLFFNNFTERSFRALLGTAGFTSVHCEVYLQREDIDLWIDTHETPFVCRQEIRDLYRYAPAEIRKAHPFEVSSAGAISDWWRWCVFSAFKPG